MIPEEISRWIVSSTGILYIIKHDIHNLFFHKSWFDWPENGCLMISNSFDMCTYSICTAKVRNGCCPPIWDGFYFAIQSVQIERKPGQTCPFLWDLTGIWIIFGIYLLEGYPVFPTVPRNVGSITSLMNTRTLTRGLQFDFVPNPLNVTAYYCARRFEMPAHLMM